ncbi:metalloprotease PmbA [Burkholderiaceae bacterium DAT-1]|nr:metalloprotease PmbA [Burkholderiaceae bacterium DAT-1]
MTRLAGLVAGGSSRGRINMNDKHRGNTGFSMAQAQLQQLVSDALNEAKQLGATACDVDITEGVGQSVAVRLGEVETIEYNRDKAISITAYVGQAKGHASSSDFSPAAIAQTAAAAVAIARHTAADPCAGLPDADRLATTFRELDLYHPWSIDVESAITMALDCEAAARGVDPRISNSEGANVASHTSHSVFANSLGFMGYQQSSRHYLSCTVIAQEGEAMQRDYWHSSQRCPDDLDTPEAVGRKAGERALSRLGARRIPTGEYPVLFEPAMAAGLLGHFVSAISGGALYRGATFLADSLGKQVFSPIVRLSEDPFIPRAFGSGNFDAEGVATQARDLLVDGVVQGYILGSYSARKLGMQSTGNAGGTHNLILHSTAGDFTDMLKRLGTGLLVTEMLGQGVNSVTGDYSRGAAGYWVENGQIMYPVEEITIAGNLKDMFRQIVAIGSDVEIRGAKRLGSVLIERMRVAGL